MKQLELRSAYFERYCRNWLSFTELNDSGSKFDSDSGSKIDLSSDIITVTILVNLSIDLMLPFHMGCNGVAWIYGQLAGGRCNGVTWIYGQLAGGRCNSAAWIYGQLAGSQSVMGICALCNM